MKLAGLASAGMAGLAGCTGGDGNGGGGDGGNGGGSNQLEIVHWWTAGGEKEALDALLEGFQQRHGDVEINNNPAPGGAGSALDTVIKNRVLNENPPSTFQIWPGKALAPYTSSDVLEDVSDVWNDDMRNAYRESVQNAAQPAGTLVSVPINIHRLNNVFYNVSVLEQAGVDPSGLNDPQAMADALDAVATETDAAPLAHSTQDPWPTLQLWETEFIARNGVGAFDDFAAGNVQQHEGAIRESLQAVAGYREYFNGDAGSISWDQANTKIVEGDAAFIHQGDWAAGQYEASEGFEFESDWNYAPYPGTDGVYSMVMDSFVFPKNNPSPDATRKFLSYCGTADAQRRFNPVKGSIPPRTDVSGEEFGPFLTRQIEQFKASDSQPLTIAHGSAVTPEVKSNMEEAFAGFNENWNVDRAYEGINSAF